ncbi:MAG: 3-beta hydroxysteroid dehydrogenase, partial [Chloroflexi bacterium]|nr:3-beta hydroxysteroid dehydrogenase [Chloroflexota bacterium]
LLRPTMIYGTPRDRNIWRLIQFLRRSPAMPIVGSGRHLQQPVYVADVAEAVARVLEVDATIGQAYDLPGAEPLTFVEVIDTLSRLLGRRIHKVFIPPWLGLAAARLSRSLPLGPRISPEQILRLEEDKAYDFDPARDDFGYRPLSFFDGALREMGYLA